ncbi:MAG: maltose alpha-D-glucosyltransferase [Candidatus Competibacteraceae bacterium]|nr:maltose alpha-D-glucosyltransferase [Candidatus Competibacteraceae bacterium]
MTQENQTLSWKDDPLWFKDAIIYQLHIKAYNDSNNDGYGDFKGLMHKLDYIQDLGVNTLWLLPFYPSPLRDDGYDIADYRNVNPQYGNRQDVKNFVREAHRRNLKVVTELVINHTSDQHPWFQAARRAPKGSAKRDFYMWSDTDSKYQGVRIIFTDTEISNWAWDPVAKQYYWHRFFSHQPDLNFDNPQVRRAVIKVMNFWFDMGVDGMRLDAIPYLVAREGTNCENLPETHAALKEMRTALDARYKNKMFLAEANQWPEDTSDYFGDGDECHMAYHFPLMPRMYMAVAQEDRHPIIDIMRQTPAIPDNCQWTIFLRNHDELTLEMVTDKERDYMYQTYAADKRMRINVGIRRRLAPLMDNDADKIKLMNNLLMSMPGSPIVYYGDEIGMGDNIYLGDRDGVRTPMQWSPDRNAGFSRADPQRLYLPPVMDPIYGYEAVNVEAQSRSPSSQLNWMKRLIAVRKNYKAFGRGTLEFLHPGNRKILAYLRRYEDEIILCVTNLSRSAQPVELDLSAYAGLVPVEMMDRVVFPPVGELPYLLTLQRYGFYWFRLVPQESVDMPAWHHDVLPRPELSVLVLFEGWKSFFAEQVQPAKRKMADALSKQLQDEVLPPFLATQRWFAAKGERIKAARVRDSGIWQSGKHHWLLTGVEVEFEDAPTQNYFLPLSNLWESDTDHSKALWPVTLARVRDRANVGVLYDAFTDEFFCRALVETVGRGEEIQGMGGTLRFFSTRAFGEVAGDDIQSLEVKRAGAESSNTGVIIGQRMFLKGYRRIQSGINPELEIGRFLTEASPFANIVPVAGALELRKEDGTTATLALLQSFVSNQGDAWSHTLDYLKRFLEDCLLRPDEVREQLQDWHGVDMMLMRTLGLRTGELHVALAKQTGDPAFDPEPIGGEDLKHWTETIRQEALDTFNRLERNRDKIPEVHQAGAQRLAGSVNSVLDHLGALAPADIQAVKTRFHGDYHLGQVLVSKNDFIIIDFEGEPARTLEERRRKNSPLKDVAGMLRSFNYAAFAALEKFTAEKPENAALLEPFIQDWERKARSAFMEGYREAVEGCPVWPENSDHAQGLIDLFTLEKALYELRYELDNRPTWVGVPLNGLLELLPGQGPRG